MGLTGKLVRQVEIKSDGDVFHELFRAKPHHISTMSPGNIHGVDLHEGDWGHVGSVISWNYTHDSTDSEGQSSHRWGMKLRHKPHHISTMSPGDMVLICMKEVVEAIDEENKSVTFKVIDGDLTELYKAFKGTVHVDTKGENNLVTWTLEYEKKSENAEDPNTLMDFVINVTKDIETHHLK
ncbi:hypothetical protein TEA_008783 [Camellia sinensis var. sinensis]|uniref:Bet v I/Major latex protein domain-containing protein n=1 Tax=Camellia sinensis var. sinensis TaxID=542762 RepID=A0A4S4EHG9_CAMSN|nr:hypothetical protein TEA_008783 [Camellia sinensis var. sinensis]